MYTTKINKYDIDKIIENWIEYWIACDIMWYYAWLKMDN